MILQQQLFTSIVPFQKQPLNKAENSSMQHKPSYKVVVY